MQSITNRCNRWLIHYQKKFVAHRLVIDYSLIIGNNQWLINWLPIDYLLITHWCHWCHRLVLSGMVPSAEFICLRVAYRAAFWEELGRLIWRGRSIRRPLLFWVHRPLQKCERAGKEYGCFPFVWKTKVFKMKDELNLRVVSTNRSIWRRKVAKWQLFKFHPK